MAGRWTRPLGHPALADDEGQPSLPLESPAPVVPAGGSDPAPSDDDPDTPEYDARDEKGRFVSKDKADSSEE